MLVTERAKEENWRNGKTNKVHRNGILSLALNIKFNARRLLCFEVYIDECKSLSIHRDGRQCTTNNLIFVVLHFV